MAEVIRSYRQEAPALRFIGKRYSDADRVDGGFGAVWESWFEKGYFGVLEGASSDMEVGYGDVGDSDAYIGLMRWKDGEPFQYWVGMFMPPDTVVPDGFACVDFEAASWGMCWLQGAPGTVFAQECTCAQRLKDEGYVIRTDAAGACWFFERYHSPRFTAPDERGNIILDIGHFVE